jgi:glycosyltransferase involved in cell wall biosynthesis
MKRLIYIVSDINKSLHFEWAASFLSTDFALTFILIGQPNTHLEKYLRERNVKTYLVKFNHSKLTLLPVWLRVFWILINERPNIIHTHLWIANVIGLSAGFVARIKKRVYTRHHATIHHKEIPTGLKWDKLSNALATHIIAPSVNVKNILLQLDKASPSKVRVIHHGFDLDYFRQINSDNISYLKKKYGIEDNAFVFGVISRFVYWKGIQYIIPAFQKILARVPTARLVLANASGSYAGEIHTMLKNLPPSSYVEIAFENDLTSLYRIFDVFIHTPIDASSEAFGQTYIESLIVGIPSIFTLSGVAAEIIQPESNALVVDFKNEDALFNAMSRLASDKLLRSKLSENGKDTANRFSFQNYITALKSLYLM